MARAGFASRDLRVKAGLGVAVAKRSDVIFEREFGSFQG